MSIAWHDRDRLYGIDVRAFFFEARTVNQETDLARRVLPFFTTVRPKTLFTEEDRMTFKVGQIAAQPDVVFEHGNGLICVEFKSIGGRLHRQEEWRQSIRLKDMLQCLIGGYVAAQHYKQVTACVLRYNNVCYLMTPEPRVMHLLLDMIPMAMGYYGEDRYIASAKLAGFAVDRISNEFPGPDDPRKQAGKKAHDTMLRR